MTYTKLLTQKNNSSKIVIRSGKGVASFPSNLKQPIPQEKLWWQYWKD